MTHEDRVQAAKKAINAVFGDTSVDHKTTRESLKELRDEITVLLDAVGQ